MRIEVPSSEALLNPDHPCPTMNDLWLGLLAQRCLFASPYPSVTFLLYQVLLQDLQKPKSSLRVAQVRQVFWGHASAAVLPPPSKPPIEGLLSRVG